jgi:signal transduction histidine kinase
LLNLISDPDNNIQYLVTSSGEILGGDCAAYHCIRGSRVHIKAEWNVPAEHKTMYSLGGNPFFHLLSQKGDAPFFITNSEEMSRFFNGSLALHLPYKTLLAIPVKTGTRITGSLHLAYCQPVTFTITEINSFSILAKAIGNEEGRKKALLELRKRQARLIKSEKSLKYFSAKILSIREDEKKNISSALHDEIGSMAVALSAPLTLAKDEVTENNSEQALKCILQTEAVLKQSVARLKSIVHDLRPPDLDIAGLSACLKNHFLFLSTQSKIAIDFSTTVQDRLIRGEKAIILYRVCQEAVNNALSHAHPLKISVQLTSSKGSINLAIQDDGCGFDYKKQSTHHLKSSQLGIISMRERVESLGGLFTIESVINKGTSVLVSIPQR